MPTVPEAHMCSVRALSALGRMPRASATSEAMCDWKAVRSGITEPTTRPSRSLGLTPGMESKHALPASQTRSRYVAFRTPNFDTPAPTSATFRISASDPSPRPPRPSDPHARAAVHEEHLARDERRLVRGEEHVDRRDLVRRRDPPGRHLRDDLLLDRVGHAREIGRA